MTDDRVTAALNLMRHLPPEDTAQNLGKVLRLIPDQCEELLSAIDQPLQVASDPYGDGKEFLRCDYNRDEDGYRSPWSNMYSPPLNGDDADPDGLNGYFPTSKLRELEIELNTAFEVYRDHYFEGGISSVYVWSYRDDFACTVALKKETNDANGKGSWDSIHVFEVTKHPKHLVYEYKLTSTVMLWMENASSAVGTMKLGGSFTRQLSREYSYGDLESHSHLVCIGTMVEDHEAQMRSSIDHVYFGKTQQVVKELRSAVPAGGQETNELIADLKKALNV